MRGLYGRYEKSLDSKNRLIVPNALRKKLEGEELVLVRWFDKCLALFPESVFMNIAEGIGKLPVPIKNTRGMRRQLFGGACGVVFDSQGRINIPDYLLEYAEMNSREVVIIGDLDKVEIWPKQRFDEFERQYQKTVNEDYEQTLARVADMAQPASDMKSTAYSESSGERGKDQ